MKAIFIVFNQAYYDQVVAVLDSNNCRGFTYTDVVRGRGSKTGEPHFGSHAWPTLNGSILSVVEDHRVANILDTLRRIDQRTEAQGLRAFVWHIEDGI